MYVSKKNSFCQLTPVTLTTKFFGFGAKKNWQLYNNSLNLNDSSCASLLDVTQVCYVLFMLQNKNVFVAYSMLSLMARATQK